MSKHRNRAQWPSSRRAIKPRIHESAIVDHVTHHLAPPAFVIHELVSDKVHVDVHVVAPGPGHEYFFLFTTGMSTLPMTKPRDAPGSRYGELSMLLPSNWIFDRAAWDQDERWFWPIRELRAAALLPHRHRTWLGWGHTLIEGDRFGSFDPSTRLSAWLVLGPPRVPKPIPPIRVDNFEIDLLTLIAVYPEELAYSVDHGAEALVERFEHAQISDVLEPQRPSAVPKTKKAADAASSLVEIRGIEPDEELITFTQSCVALQCSSSVSSIL